VLYQPQSHWLTTGVKWVCFRFLGQCSDKSTTKTVHHQNYIECVKECCLLLSSVLCDYVYATTVLRPFFWDHPGKPVPGENFWTLWCNGRLTEADTLTIRMGATPSGLTSAHLHHPTHIFLQAGCSSCRPTNSVKALKAIIMWLYLHSICSLVTKNKSCNQKALSYVHGAWQKISAVKRNQ